MHWAAQQHQEGQKDHRRWLKCMMTELFPLLRKTAANQIKNTPKRGSSVIATVCNQQTPCEWKYSEFTARCKPLVRLKSKRARLDFTRKHLKEAAQLWETFFVPMKPRWGQTAKNGKEEKHRIICQTWCAPASRTGSLVFIDNASANRIISEVYSPLRFSQMPQNWQTVLHSTSNMMTQSILQKQPTSFST